MTARTALLSKLLTVRIATRNTQPTSTISLDADYTAMRLGVASLAYLVAMTLVVTLTPFRFLSRPVHGITELWSVTDVVMNIVMFVPLGFLYSLTRRNRVMVARTALLLGFMLSATIECAQLYEIERYTSPADVATNGLGALIGALTHDRLLRRFARDRDIEGSVQTLALELPLMGLVYLLVPLLWLVGLGAGEGARAWLALPVAAFGGAIIGAVHGGYLQPMRNTTKRALVISTLVWTGVAGVMILRSAPPVFAACLAVAVIGALLQSSAASSVRRNGRNRRFELPTLRMSLPFFAAYLALSSLWPLDGADLLWRAGFEFFPSATHDVNLEVYRALEHIAAFTLVGYVIAEVHGRADRAYRDMVFQVALWGGALALLLQAARGIHPMYGASVLLGLMAAAATIFGGWMYHLQRDHIRALASRARTP